MHHCSFTREKTSHKADMKFITVVVSTLMVTLFLLQGVVVHGASDTLIIRDGKYTLKVMDKSTMMQKNVVFSL